MKSGKITIQTGPPVFVHLCDDEAELINAALDHHPSLKEDLDMIPRTMSPAGLTIGTNSHIHMYIRKSLNKREFKETLIHEALHVTNCVLRQRIYGTMDKEKLLIISDKNKLVVPGIESLRLSFQGIDEEDQATLNAEINCVLETAINHLEMEDGEEENET